jgi:GAF domain-containing protein
MPQFDKETTYKKSLKELDALLRDEEDFILKLSTINAVLHIHFPYWTWVGFYLVKGSELLVGPYISDHVGCLHIPFGKGVCGTAAQERTTQIVPDVNAIKNHIACDSKTQSEIVVPLFDKDQNLLGVFDADSNEKRDFDEVDKKYLEDLFKNHIS